MTAALNRHPQLNKLSLNNLIRHSTKPVTVADVSLPCLTLTFFDQVADYKLHFFILLFGDNKHSYRAVIGTIITYSGFVLFNIVITVANSP